MSEVTVPVRHHRKKLLRANSISLEDFARGIEVKLQQGYGPDAVANHICRLLTDKDPKIAAPMWCKWVEWRYGRAKEQINHTVDHSMAIAEAKALMRRMLEIDRRPRLAGTDSDSVTIIDHGTG